MRCPRRPASAFTVLVFCFSICALVNWPLVLVVTSSRLFTNRPKWLCLVEFRVGLREVNNRIEKNSEKNPEFFQWNCQRNWQRFLVLKDRKPDVSSGKFKLRAHFGYYFVKFSSRISFLARLLDLCSSLCTLISNLKNDDDEPKYS